MKGTAPHQTPDPSHPPQPNPQTDPASTAVPRAIARVLGLVRTLLGYARHLDSVLPARETHPSFPVLAAAFGTFDTKRVLGHIQRAIVRAMMLEKYLLALAKQGRDVEPQQPPPPADPDDVAAHEVKLRAQRTRLPRRPRIDPTDPLKFEHPNLKQLESEVCNRPVGETLAAIALDLAIAANICDPKFWADLVYVVYFYGGIQGFSRMRDAEESRRASFEKESRRRNEDWTGNWGWRDRPHETMREFLGFTIGEPIPPPDPPLAAAPA